MDALSPFALILLAAAFYLAPSAPLQRTSGNWRGPKHPRDGPAEISGGIAAWLPESIRTRVHEAQRQSQGNRLAVAADISLFAACVSAGLSTGQAAGAVAAAAGDTTRGQWQSVAALLTVGVDPVRAWSPMAEIDGLSELAGLARMSQRSGAAVAAGCERIAASLRSEAAETANAAAERAGVFIALPLAICFLPGFIVLGLAPVVIGLGTQILNP
ncbi:type II secretion system F family protein [Corynebacterium sp. A21]|uniref:type II secretion system F family protein n=1 Tax=Corynebacterium sp. A21 TaxID=3457318 RepID=UPI003FD2161E